MVSEIFLRDAGQAARCPDCGSDDMERLISASYMIKSAPVTGNTCCGRTERCATPPCSSGDTCQRGRKVETINLEPGFSTKEIPGKCIKCLAEQELNNCLMELLRGEEENKELEQRFEALLSFLKSPESSKLRDEAERYLSEGRRVSLQISFEQGQPKYEIKVT